MACNRRTAHRDCCLLYTSNNKSIDAFAVRFCVGFDFSFSAFGYGDFQSVIIVFDIFHHLEHHVGVLDLGEVERIADEPVHDPGDPDARCV